MYLLNLLPWCRLDREYKIGEILLRPYALGDELPEVGDETLRRYVEEIVSCYRDIDGRPFGHPSIAWWDGRSALSALTDEEAEILSETVTAACFGSLADRGIASAGGNYSNASRFVLYRYRFVRPSGFTSVVHRRRDGRTFDGRELAELRFTAPTETTTRSDISINEPLARAVVAFLATGPERARGKLYNAVWWFNLGNSDSETLTEHMELVAHASAIQELLETQSSEYGFARDVSSNLTPLNEIPASTSQRNGGFWNDSPNSLRHEWARELYRLRNQYAHGRTRPQNQKGWSHLEHLTLAAIAFPLLVKQYLHREGRYTLGSIERAKLSGFEQLTDSTFLQPEPSDEYERCPWDRIVSREALKAAIDGACEKMSKLPPPTSSDDVQ